ncbi:hypothetical protein [Amycolatopsis taiwanensis]|uniref:Tetratricopeptide repeat protein n=1 Tax=Amycolatopsis taiwanensis TaxID=342230 RepID=A0A9W6R6V2_9PSEU|nr:hypothetical protein [Amycolatopsis taiwanensis]GLY70496.1 hypothetical protein Atai01_71150 [Amycolatopsis taiwanensis]
MHNQLDRQLEAADFHRRALAINAELGNRYVETSCMVNPGLTYTNLRQLDLAGNYLRKAVELSRQIGSREEEARSRCLLADCLRLSGELAEANGLPVDAGIRQRLADPASSA